MSLLKKESANGNSDGNSSSSQLLRDIEIVSKALYLQKPPPKSLISSYHNRSKSAERIRFTGPKSSLNSGNFNENLLQKNKKSSSLWNWKKPLKALAHIGDHRFNMCFFLHVHSIEGLPKNFSDLNLRVYWKRKDEVLGTCSSRVLQGTAEFGEILVHKCSVYGSRSGAHNPAKYEAKLCLIQASVVGALGVDIGKHWVDLTRLLPLTLEELEGEKSSGKWTTSFKLAGKAQGATLNVSFGFSVVKDNLIESKNYRDVLEPVNLQEGNSTTLESVEGFGVNNNNKMLPRLGSVRRKDHGSFLSSTSRNVNVYHEVSPIMDLELSKSINVLYEKLNEGNLNSSKFDLSSTHAKLPSKLDFETSKDDSESQFECPEFTVVDKGIELSEKEQLEPRESIYINDDCIGEDNTALEERMECNLKGDACCRDMDEVLVNDRKHEESTPTTSESTIQELELTFDEVFISELKNLESTLSDDFFEAENYLETKSSYKSSKILKTSLSLDDVTEEVASDFLKMLGVDQAPSGFTSDSNPESPRELLLREFEKEALNSGGSIFGFVEREEDQLEFSCNASTGSRSQDSYGNLDLFPDIRGSEGEQSRAGQLLKNRRKVNTLEDLETERLLREWGLNESAFQSSPHYCSDGFGSPVELPPEAPLELPPLGDGFGPFVETKSGGYLRSMNPSVLLNAKNVGGSLVMQISRPVVLPAEMGSEFMGILQQLASVGIGKLSMRVNKLMPLEDITGKTLQEVVQEAVPTTMVPDRQTSLKHGSFSAHYSFTMREEDEELQVGWSNACTCSSLICGGMGTGFVSLTDFACLATYRIEALLIDGLRIQCGMADMDAPSCIRTQSIGNNSTSERKMFDVVGSLSVEGSDRLQVPDIRDDANDVDELMDLSITLDEWLKLDSETIDDEDQISVNSLRILASHRSKYTDLVSGTLARDFKCQKASDKNPGMLGNPFTVALMVLLRDPLRNFEPVGSSMLALFQVDRVFGPVKSRIYSAMRDGSVAEDTEASPKEEVSDKREDEKEGTWWFKFSEVHLAGLNTEFGKNHLWGSKMQQQYGTRWLLASGMAKSNKHSLSKSKANVISNRQRPKKAPNEDVLWSITSNINDAGTTWQELAALVPYIRNPDIVFPTENTRSHVI